MTPTSVVDKLLPSDYQIDMSVNPHAKQDPALSSQQAHLQRSASATNATNTPRPTGPLHMHSDSQSLSNDFTLNLTLIPGKRSRASSPPTKLDMSTDAGTANSASVLDSDSAASAAAVAIMQSNDSLYLTHQPLWPISPSYSGPHPESADSATLDTQTLQASSVSSQQQQQQQQQQHLPTPSQTIAAPDLSVFDASSQSAGSHTTTQTRQSLFEMSSDDMDSSMDLHIPRDLADSELFGGVDFFQPEGMHQLDPFDGLNGSAATTIARMNSGPIDPLDISAANNNADNNQGSTIQPASLTASSDAAMAADISQFIQMSDAAVAAQQQQQFRPHSSTNHHPHNHNHHNHDHNHILHHSNSIDHQAPANFTYHNPSVTTTRASLSSTSSSESLSPLELALPISSTSSSTTVLSSVGPSGFTSASLSGFEPTAHVSALLEQQRRASMPVATATTLEIGDKKQHCKICGKYFKRDLPRHMRTHEEVARFVCPFPREKCQHKRGQFNRPYDFKKHLLHGHFVFDDQKEVRSFRDLRSKLDKPGTCNCGMRFLANEWLEQHVLDGANRCPLLANNHSQEQNQQQHQQNMHNGSTSSLFSSTSSNGDSTWKS